MNVIIPVGTKYIGLDAFSGCSQLARIALPSGLCELEDADVFAGCEALREISFGGNAADWENIMRGRVISIHREDMSVLCPKITLMNLKR